MRGMYADVDELCRGVEAAASAEASEESLHRLVEPAHDQQREPGQLRLPIRYPGKSDQVIGRVLGDAAPPEDAENASGIA